MEEYMLPCLNKQIFGIECIGCGIQRAAALLFRGEFIAAFKMYPAIYTLLFLGVFLIINLFVKFKAAFKIKVGLLFLNIIVMIVSYVIKLTAVH